MKVSSIKMCFKVRESINQHMEVYIKESLEMVNNKEKVNSDCQAEKYIKANFTIVNSRE
jgi:hypothetical protein